MDAELLMRERVPVSERAFAELVIWRVPQPIESSGHAFKYRLAFIVDGVCVLRYDNEAGKGDHHRHVGETETDYRFTSIERLLADFWTDVDQWELA